MSKRIYALFGALFIFSIPTVAFASNGKIDTGDTAFVFIAAAMVFIMIPGLALFYGGMARKKNALNTMMMSFILMSIITIEWIFIGFSMAFGTDVGHVLGAMNFAGFAGVGGAPDATYAGTIPFALFALYQMMFAIITPALFSGAVAGRMRFPAFIAFALIWSVLVYNPLAHWVWGTGGWLRNLGVLDFAGGIVVHISAGVAALVAALVLGERKGYRVTSFLPHNIPLTLIGTGLLWFGWFGFNGGSALAANGVAINAALVSNASAAAALLSWAVVETLHRGKPTVMGALTGAVVGLAAITPAAGYVNVVCAIVIGLVASPLSYFFVSFVKFRLGYDDALDVFGCHGVGCIWGVLATGLFASKAVNEQGANGLFYGNPAQLGIQAIGVIVAIAFSGALTFVILKALSLFMRLRENPQMESDGMDITQHGETAYPDMSAE
jgi:ammonium transporter, Amt family